MKINWKVRFKNYPWMVSFFGAILTFVYTMLGLFDIYPEITKNDVGEIINAFLMMLSLMGVMIDPTTAGIEDSDRAMQYVEPGKLPEEVEGETEEEPNEETHDSEDVEE